MPNARIVSIAAGLTVQAKDVSGAWRTLANNDLIADQEEIRAYASGPQYGLVAYKLQRLVAAAWTDALSPSLSVRDGTSHWRQDKFQIQGNSVNSAVALILTVNKGQRGLRDALSVLQVEQTDAGGQFSYPSVNGAKFKGLFSAVTRESTLEEGGFLEGIDAQLVCDREQFEMAIGPNGLAGVTPAVGQALLWFDGSSVLKIEKIDVDEISFVLHLSSVNR